MLRARSKRSPKSRAAAKAGRLPRGLLEHEHALRRHHVIYGILDITIRTCHGSRGTRESLWVSEHSHLPVTGDSSDGDGEPQKVQGEVMDPFLTLTAAAMATKTLRLGTGICLVNQRDPIQTAKLVASLDH